MEAGTTAPHHPATLSSQSDIDGEIAEIRDEYVASNRVVNQPRLNYSPYRSSVLRHPTTELHLADPEGVELWAPVFGDHDVDPLEADLTIQQRGAPIGEKIEGSGRLLDGEGRGVAG